MRRGRALASVMAAVGLVTSAGGGGVQAKDDHHSARIVDVCDGSERDPQMGVPVPADYDICALTISQPDPSRRRHRLELSLDMRQTPSTVTSAAVGVQAFWTLTNGCQQGFWRRVRADSGAVVVELFERCAGEARYRFIPGVVSSSTTPRTITVEVEDDEYRPGTSVRLDQVFTEVSLFALGNPQQSDGRVHGGAGVADVATATPGADLRLRG